MTVKLNVFDFTVSRHRDGPQLFFQDYRQILLGDCWSGFESIAVASGGAIVRAACNSHARRKLFLSGPFAPRGMSSCCERLVSRQITRASVRETQGRYRPVRQWLAPEIVTQCPALAEETHRILTATIHRLAKP